MKSIVHCYFTYENQSSWSNSFYKPVETKLNSIHLRTYISLTWKRPLNFKSIKHDTSPSITNRKFDSNSGRSSKELKRNTGRYKKIREETASTSKSFFSLHFRNSSSLFSLSFSPVCQQRERERERERESEK